MKLETDEIPVWDAVASQAAVAMAEPLARLLSKGALSDQVSNALLMISVTSAGLADRIIQLRRTRTNIVERIPSILSN